MCASAWLLTVVCFAEDAASRVTPAPVEAIFGAGSMWDDSVSPSGGSSQGKGVVTRKEKGAKKRRSRVQGAGWADR